MIPTPSTINQQLTKTNKATSQQTNKGIKQSRSKCETGYTNINRKSTKIQQKMKIKQSFTLKSLHASLPLETAIVSHRTQTDSSLPVDIDSSSSDSLAASTLACLPARFLASIISVIILCTDIATKVRVLTTAISSSGGACSLAPAVANPSALKLKY